MILSKAYIEDYHYIKLIVPSTEQFLINVDELYINNGYEFLKLFVFKTEQFNDVYHIHTTFKGRILLHKDYYINLANDEKIHLDLGQIMRTERFDVENYYDGPLGVEYHQDYSVFRVWSPVAKEIKLVLKKDEEQVYNLKYVSEGLWELKLDGDFERYCYHYEVRVNLEFKRTLDPYAFSSSANSKENYVIDFSKTHPFSYPKTNFSGNYLESMIYELHLKDLNVQKQASSYLALLDKLPYIKDLGVTHLQIMPLNAFGGVLEDNKEALYNWGYNPVEYNVPTGWYASMPNDPYNRLNELKMMIEEIHKQGLLVNLDVVYNHVYVAEEFSLNTFVPGYVYRTDNYGFMTNGSGCGTDFASERRMNRRFIIDSLKHWILNYDIDGFRFDLMGLLDFETLREARKELIKIKPYLMLYGEGWNLSTGLPEPKRSTINNYWALPNFAYFNDVFRNLMRGEPYNNKGFIYNRNHNLKNIAEVIKGSSCRGFLFKKPSQSINYVECHDNLTFFDKLRQDLGDIETEEQVKYAILSLGLVVLSLGIPFIQAGQELLRSKRGIDNTYNLGMEINGLSYEKIEEYQIIINALKYFINFRQKEALYKLNNPEIIEEKLIVKATPNNTILYETDEMEIIFKNNKIEENFIFERPIRLVFEGIKEVDKVIDDFKADDIGVYIIYKM